MSVEQRVDKVEEAISIMKTLLVSHDERLEDYFNALNREREAREESRKDFEFKMNALIDSQIKTEAELIELRKSTTELRKSTTELRKSTTELRKSTTELKEASKSQLNRIEKIENKDL